MHEFRMSAGFIGDRDIVEKVQIVLYCKDANNSYENLVILCPNCHTMYDKISKISLEEIRGWKHTRKKEVKRVFCERVPSFEELKQLISFK